MKCTLSSAHIIFNSSLENFFQKKHTHAGSLVYYTSRVLYMLFALQYSLRTATCHHRSGNEVVSVHLGNLCFPANILLNRITFQNKLHSQLILFAYLQKNYYLCAEFCVKTIINHKKQLYYV